MRPRALDRPSTDGKVRYEFTRDELRFYFARQSPQEVSFEKRWILGRSHPPAVMLRDVEARDAFLQRAASDVVLSGRCHERETVPFNATDDAICQLSLQATADLGDKALAEHVCLVADITGWRLFEGSSSDRRLPPM